MKNDRLTSSATVVVRKAAHDCFRIGLPGTPVFLVSRAMAATLRRKLNAVFAKGCEKHGAMHCIECEKRCRWCGDDGEMVKREAARVCTNCAWAYDNGDIVT